MVNDLSSTSLDQWLTTITQLREVLTIAAYARKIAPFERTISKAMTTFFRQQGLALGTALADRWGLSEKANQLNYLDKLFDDHVDTKIDFVTKALKDSYVAGMAFAGKEYNLGISFNVKNPRAIDYVDKRGLTLLKEVNTATKEDIRTIVSDGIANGDSYQTIASAIKSQFVSYGTTRATTVAVTEVGKAYQAGNYGAIQDATDTGLTFEKSWSAESDACPICDGNAAENWIDLDAVFSSGDQYPVAHPNCRCAALYRRKA